MASTNIQKRPNGKWRARYRDAAGKEHARHFDLKKDAQAWLNEVTASVVRGDYVDPRKSSITVKQVSEAWKKTPSWSESNRARNVSALENHVLPRWGELPLSEVHHEDIQAWVGEMAESGAKAATVERNVGALRGVLALAVRSKRISFNPATDLDMPKRIIVQRRYLDFPEVEKLVEAADEYGPVVQVLAYCGLRFGELAALHVSNVDPLRRRFRIEESVTEVDGKLVRSAPKDYQRRSVPYPKFMDGVIAETIKGKGRDDILFPTSRGNVMRVRNARRDWFDIAVKIAGIGKLTPHELRHTAASLAVKSGASVLAVQRMLGHDKPATTLNVYADLFDEDLDVLAERMSLARDESLADYLRTGTGSALPIAKGASL